MQRAAAVWMAGLLLPVPAAGYVFNRTVADMRNPANAGLSACPQPNRFHTAVPGNIKRRWNTTLGTNIRTVALDAAGRQAEVGNVIVESFGVWTGVPGTTLVPSTLGALGTTTASGSCNSSDGLNTICFAQSATFAGGVLAFTNSVTSDILGETWGASGPSAFIGEILDTDVLFNPATTFATPGTLTANPSAFDLESVLIHELGHFVGFSHSGVWRAMMFPFAPPPGQFLGDRPTTGRPDAPLADDDRTGLRAIYPDTADIVNVARIEGRILPANPLSLPASPPGITGIFGAHVAAVDDATGALVAATLTGWSCSGLGPAQFDGTYVLERLPVGRTYKIFVEPLDDPVRAANIQNATSSLCRNAMTDPGWPAQFACMVPAVNTNFTTRTRP